MNSKTKLALILATISILMAATAALALEVVVSNSVDTRVSLMFSYVDATTGRVTTKGWFRVQPGETKNFAINADGGQAIYAAAFNKDQYFDSSTRSQKPVVRWCSSHTFTWEGEGATDSDGAWSAKFFPVGNDGNNRVVRIDAALKQ